LNGARIDQDKWSEVKIKDQLCFGTPISNNSFRYILEQLTSEDYQLVLEEFIAKEELSGGIKKKLGKVEVADPPEAGAIPADNDKEEPTSDSSKVNLKQRDEVTNTTSGNKSTRDEMVSAMQEEFLCVICQELFVKAHSLSCSHSYCEKCINDWIAKGNKYCPMCRKTIEGKPVPSIAMDNAINKLVECLPEGAQKEREELLKERSTKNKNDVILISDSPVRPGSSGVITRSRARLVINVDLESSNFDSSSELSSSESDNDPERYDDYGDFYDYDDIYDDDHLPGYTGLPGHSWGGFGRCYRCGKHFSMTDHVLSISCVLQEIQVTGLQAVPIEGANINHFVIYSCAK